MSVETFTRELHPGIRPGLIEAADIELLDDVPVVRSVPPVPDSALPPTYPASHHELTETVLARTDIDWPEAGTDLSTLRVRVNIPGVSHDKPAPSEIVTGIAHLDVAMHEATARNVTLVRQAMARYPVSGFAPQVCRPLYLVDRDPTAAPGEVSWSYSPHGQEGPLSRENDQSCANDQIVDFLEDTFGDEDMEVAKKEVVVAMLKSNGMRQRMVRRYTVIPIKPADGPVRETPARELNATDVPAEVGRWNIIVAETELQQKPEKDDAAEFTAVHTTTEAWVTSPNVELTKAYRENDKPTTEEMAAFIASDAARRQQVAETLAGCFCGRLIAQRDAQAEVDTTTDSDRDGRQTAAATPVQPPAAAAGTAAAGSRAIPGAEAPETGVAAVGDEAGSASESAERLMTLQEVTDYLNRTKDQRLAERMRCGRRAGFTVIRREIRRPEPAA